MFEKPQFLKYSGTAKLFTDSYQVNVSFKYYLIKTNGILFCTSNQQISLKQRVNISEERWCIEGITEEGKPFYTVDLFLTKFNGNDEFEFVPQKDIIIGDIIKESNIDRAIYFVYNLFILEFEFEYLGFKIIVEKLSNSDHELITKYWEIPQIGSRITLTKKDSSKEDYTFLINYIVQLLSFATGKNLSFPYREFVKNEKSMILISNARSTEKGIQNIIDNKDLSGYLLEVLPYFEDDFGKEHIELKTLIEYINKTDNGYLDDRVLSLIQAWEIIANNWSKKNVLSKEKKELQKDIRNVVKDWHRKYPQYDNEKVILSQRICDSICWDKTINLLNNLLNEFKFKVNALNLDFKSLVGWRHKVAHEGMLRGTDNNEVADKLLDAQMGIRLLILKHLGYSGKVLPNKGYDKNTKLSYYFYEEQ